MFTYVFNMKIKDIFYDKINKYPKLLTRPKNSAAVFTKNSLFIIEKSNGTNGFGNGEIISITTFRMSRLGEPTQFGKFKDAVERAKSMGLKIKGLPRMLITIEHDKKIEVTTDEEVMYYTFSENYWNMLWLPDTFADWKDTSNYYYKKQFNYWFTLHRNDNAKGIVFVNRGVIINDISMSSSTYSYNVRGWTGLTKYGRSEYITLVRIDGAHGYYHIHFSEVKNGGMVLLPSYDVQNIEVRVSESKLKYLNRKLKRLNEKEKGLVIVG